MLRCFACALGVASHLCDEHDNRRKTKMDLSKMTWGEMKKEEAALDAYLMKRSPKYKRAMALREEMNRVRDLAREEAKELDKKNHFKNEVWTVKEFEGSIEIEGREIFYKIGTRNVKAKPAHVQRPFTII